jgi:hypothetical protein
MMPRGSLLISALVVCHLLAILVSTIPEPTAPILPNPDIPRSERSNRLAQLIGPSADVLAQSVSAAHRAIWSSFGPAIDAARFYVSVVGVRQNWAMFGSPPRYDSYARARYYVASARKTGVSWTATELAMPATQEDDIRVLESFPGSFWDKAFEVSMVEFWQHRRKYKIGPETSSQELPDDLRPALRYLVRRFAENHLVPGERVVRAEFWYGTADNPPPESTVPAGSPPARLEIMHRYYAGPVELRLPNPPIPPYHSVEREGDIVWVLEYFDGDAAD